jgi:hypothetical protein
MLSAAVVYTSVDNRHVERSESRRITADIDLGDRALMEPAK